MSIVMVTASPLLSCRHVISIIIYIATIIV